MSSQRRKITQRGNILSLPPSASSRWTAGRKVASSPLMRVEAVTFNEAGERYRLIRAENRAQS
jgi:hypothetical protein